MNLSDKRTWTLIVLVRVIAPVCLGIGIACLMAAYSTPEKRIGYGILGVLLLLVGGVLITLKVPKRWRR